MEVVFLKTCKFMAMRTCVLRSRRFFFVFFFLGFILGQAKYLREVDLLLDFYWSIMCSFGGDKYSSQLLPKMSPLPIIMLSASSEQLNTAHSPPKNNSYRIINTALFKAKFYTSTSYEAPLFWTSVNRYARAPLTLKAY